MLLYEKSPASMTQIDSGQTLRSGPLSSEGAIRGKGVNTSVIKGKCRKE